MTSIFRGLSLIRVCGVHTQRAGAVHDSPIRLLTRKSLTNYGFTLTHRTVRGGERKNAKNHSHKNMRFFYIFIVCIDREVLGCSVLAVEVKGGDLIWLL